MNAQLHEQIRESMSARSTEDLQAIWQANNRAEWSDEAFDVIRDVLQSRGADVPGQEVPIYKHEEENAVGPDDFTDEELRIVDDENPPEFYDPFEVLMLGKWLRIAAFASIVIAVVLGLAQLAGYRELARGLLQGIPGGGYAVTALSLVFALLAAAFQIVIIYFPLRALAHILRILMEMEFNSRKGAEPAR